RRTLGSSRHGCEGRPAGSRRQFAVRGRARPVCCEADRACPEEPPIVALAKAFSDRGIVDGVQVNSVLPGPVMTGRRRSYLEHWAPLHKMTVEEATANFPKEANIARYGEPEEIAELIAFLVSPGARWMTGSTLRMDGGEVKSI